ncbi:MAG: cyclic nucleotide-binding domain-containing protein, partial [Acidobacteriota bacterium]|nr:cyclic nucleotide-binding domain-containing protein [Acidobacteriota bacterium]
KVPTRIDVAVGASYLSPPNEVKDAIRRALNNAPLVMADPPPLVIVEGFGASSIDYLARFWIEDYATDNVARDQVRTNIWYEFRRANIEIPWPIQVEYHRQDQPLRTEAHVDVAAAQLGDISLFSTLEPGVRRELAAAAADHLFAAGEAIVRQGERGSSMFVVLRGGVSVVLEPSGQQVATIEAGGFFGEMSMLTGDPRTATVRAATTVQVLEITADQMRRLAQTTPGLLEHVAQVVAERRVGLVEAEASAAAAAASHASTRQSLMARIQLYLRL